jgi:hypothetical protein
VTDDVVRPSLNAARSLALDRFFAEVAVMDAIRPHWPATAI